MSPWYLIWHPEWWEVGQKKRDLLTYVYCLTFHSRNAKAKNHTDLTEERGCLVQNRPSFFSPLIKKFTFNPEFNEVLVHFALLSAVSWLYSKPETQLCPDWPWTIHSVLLSVFQLPLCKKRILSLALNPPSGMFFLRKEQQHMGYSYKEKSINGFTWWAERQGQYSQYRAAFLPNFKHISLAKVNSNW